MITILGTYTPGQHVRLYQEVLDGYGVRTNDGYNGQDGCDGYDGYLPIVTRVILPDLNMACGYPQFMTQLDVGLYTFEFCLPRGAEGVGTYFIDISYVDPVSGYTLINSYQVICLAPYGNFGTTQYPDGRRPHTYPDGGRWG